MMDDVNENALTNKKDLEFWTLNLEKKKIFDIKRKGDAIDFYANMMEYYAPKKQEGDNIIRTHSTMGFTYMFSVPIQEEIKVLDWFYRAAFIGREPICLAPAISDPYFNWFADLDIKQKHPIPPEFSFELSRIICYRVASFFPDLEKKEYIPWSEDEIKHAPNCESDHDPKWNCRFGYWMGAGEGSGRLRFLIASSGLKKGKNKNGEDEYGLGLHIHTIGRLMVTREQAQIMRLALINECEKKFGKRVKENGYNPFEDVIDAGVHKGYGGARMIGSCKVKICDKCDDSKKVWNLKEEEEVLRKFETSHYTITGNENEKDWRRERTKGIGKNSCRNCGGSKKYLENKAYEAKMIMDHRGRVDHELDYLLDDPYQAILATYIRTRVEDDDNKKARTYWKCLPGYSPSMIVEHSKQKKMPAYESTTDESREAGIGKRYGNKALETTSVFEVAKTIHDNYSELVVENLIRKGQGSYTLNVQKGSPGSQFCANCERNGYKSDHENRTHFFITPKYIEQRSYSENPECKYSKNKPRVDLPLDVKEILFGQTKSVYKNVTYLPQIKSEDANKINKENMQYLELYTDYIMKKTKECDPNKFREKEKEKKRKGMQKEKNPMMSIFKSSEPPKKKSKNLFITDENGMQWGTMC